MAYETLPKRLGTYLDRLMVTEVTRSNSVLVLNAGSSTLKFATYADDQLIGHGVVGVENGYQEAVAAMLTKVDVQHTALVAHRVVHGGVNFIEPTIVTPEVTEELERIVGLAPLHQKPAVEVMQTITSMLPMTTQVACFDTSFHSTLPMSEKRLPIPRHFFDQGIRRYGFHGLSYRSIAKQLTHISERAANGKTIVCHLGSGASLCGLVNLKSRYTTMGLTPLDGLMMGTRSGRIDPGFVFYLLNQGQSVAEIEQLLNKQSGLIGVSQISGDMKTLLASSSETAVEAVDMYCRSVAKEIGSAMVALEGIDAIVFTAGIGENCPSVRQKIVDCLRFLEISLDSAANLQNRITLHSDNSRVQVFCIPTDEQQVIRELVEPFLIKT